MKSLLDRDRDHVWHPFTQHGLNSAVLPVRSARGAYLELEDGTRLLDAISSWWVNIHGHAEPRIAKAIADQAALLEHVIFAGFTHEPAVRLAETLIAALRSRGTSLNRVFYTDNGSTAVEAALKMSYQYHLNRRAGSSALKRDRFLALKGAYHGDTLGAMSVSEPSGFHVKFKDLLVPVDFIEPDDFVQATRQFELHGSKYAALILEPRIQGAGGMRIHSAEYLSHLATLCHESGTLLIVDEIFTGFHRTGPCFAFESARIRPDLVCVSKGLTGGFLPLAAAITTEKVFEAFLSESVDDAFLHGHSYTANPIACAAALASWEILQSPDCQARIQRLGQITAERVQGLSLHSKATQARHLGTIGAVDARLTDLTYAAGSAAAGRKLREAGLKRGVLLRPLGPVLYTVPPYCLTDTELHQVYDAMDAALSSI